MMALPSQYSTLSSGTAILDVCDKCRPSSHTYSASSCPYKLCPECQELEVLDAQIINARNIITYLSKKRHELQVRINRHHDRFTSSLPIELISDIFALITNGSKDRRYPAKKGELVWNPVLKLGAVCRRWREITLSTPQLWTTLTIIPWIHGARTDIAEQWLSRSLTLPLTLEVLSRGQTDDEFMQSSLTLPDQKIIRLLKSQANRWKDLTLEGPMAMFHMLLSGLGETLSVDSLQISLADVTSRVRFNKIAMEYPFSPQRLVIELFPLEQIPIQWDRLTHLVAEYISIDGFLYIFQHAHNLQNCFVHVIDKDAGHYPIVSPVTNTSIKDFSTVRNRGFDPTFSFTILNLKHLSLPSLKTFACAVQTDRSSHGEEMEILTNFIDRHPPLTTFFFSYYHCDFGHGSMEWYLYLPSITSLKLRVREYNYGQRIQSYLEALGAHVQPMALPSLRELEISAEQWNTHCWSALAAMFPDHEDNEDVDAAPVNPRPLNTVKISLDACSEFRQRPEQIIPEGIYARLCAILTTGVKLQVFDGNHIAIFGPTE